MTNVRSEILRVRSQIQSEWRSNRRLHLFVFVMGILSIIWLHLQLEDLRQSSKEQALHSFTELQNTKVAADEADWPARELALGGTLVVLNARVWEADSKGEAQALLRDWLKREAESVGLKLVRSGVEVGIKDHYLGLYPVNADIRGGYSAGAWQKLLLRIREQEPSLVVEFEQIDLTMKPTFRLVVSGWFSLKQEEVE